MSGSDAEVAEQEVETIKTAIARQIETVTRETAGMQKWWAPCWRFVSLT